MLKQNKNLLLSGLVLMVISLPLWASKAGVMAPDFTLVDTNGTSHSLSDFRGKTVVLEWTNHECPYVKKHYESGNMQQLQADATADGVIWLTILSSAPGKQGHTSAEEANAIIKKHGAKATARLLDYDGTVGRLYDAKTTPEMFIIDANGMIQYDGAIDDKPSFNPKSLEGATNYVTATLTAMAEGSDIAVTSTPPYGCSVKY
ncbi:redoxin domain-containing protein [Marinicella sp. S1101]|uniref:redoxin domain-containing protein n=1 Tax=Marinicella marina TaxID=2996016 RepID=UPI0022609F92|nr:redoxin domain-containing protein [Marinicella marina]MCX7553634.1 redoxin domain-containing protein [Marinicella marina]MDJ1140258.1 redoxin domain-containing protein [Marinicella marina]